ncbi:MAG: redoxin domain-containing protein, partial [Alphaproteobacteria bacterium]|nr:redoxin domain-containing protein [Alphaproteobacteria bacterium]
MYTPDSPIGAGDRAPDFSLPDRTGALINLYTKIRGGTPVVVFYPDVGSFADEAAQLTNAVARVPPGAFDVFAIVRAPADALPDNIGSTASPIFVVADPDGQVAHAFGFASLSDKVALR